LLVKKRGLLGFRILQGKEIREKLARRIKETQREAGGESTRSEGVSNLFLLKRPARGGGKGIT